MSIDWNLVVEAIKAIAWPIVAGVAIYLLREPLRAVVDQIALRAKKVSVFQVSVELVTLPERVPSWSVGTVDPRRLSSSQFFDSASQSLFNELLAPSNSEYAVVDLREGQAWLTSRLFLFAQILGEVTGIRAFVFLEKTASTRRRFLGVSTPTDVSRALGRRYPWLEEAFIKALRDQFPAEAKYGDASTLSNVISPLLSADPQRISALAKRYVERLQRTATPQPSDPGPFLEITESPIVWERTSWIDGELLERDLQGVLEHAWVQELPDSPKRVVAERIARRQASFVALVERDQRFVSLVDRWALVAELVANGLDSRRAQRIP